MYLVNTSRVKKTHPRLLSPGAGKSEDRFKNEGTSYDKETPAPALPPPSLRWGTKVAVKEDVGT